MSGSVVDLSRPFVSLPDPIAADANLIIARFHEFFPGQDPSRGARVQDLFRHLLRTDQQAVLTPVVFSEIVHVAAKKTYEQLVRGDRAGLSRQFGVSVASWQDLYKLDPEPLRHLAPLLNQLRQVLTANNIVVVDPDDLRRPSSPGALHFGDELIDRMTRYGLDSSDAMITLEASRLGISAIATLDRDMRRAAPDFDIHTWL